MSRRQYQESESVMPGAVVSRPAQAAKVITRGPSWPHGAFSRPTKVCIHRVCSAYSPGPVVAVETTQETLLPIVIFLAPNQSTDFFKWEKHTDISRVGLEADCRQPWRSWCFHPCVGTFTACREGGSGWRGVAMRVGVMKSAV